MSAAPRHAPEGASRQTRSNNNRLAVTRRVTSVYAEKLLPQPHELVAFGFLIANPAPISPSL